MRTISALLLIHLLAPATVMGHTAWQTGYTIKRPGIYIFFMKTAPYWEPA